MTAAAPAHWLLVHGGPGLSSSYLRGCAEAFAPLGAWRAYDQLGSRPGEEALVPTLAALVAQLGDEAAALSAEAGTPVGVLAHSWGTHLALRALAGGLKIGGLVLVNPLPLTWEQLQADRRRLAERLAPEQAAASERLLDAADPAAARRSLELMVPAYVARTPTPLSLAFDVFRPDVTAAVNREATGYALDPAAIALPDRTLVVYGGEDYLSAGCLDALGPAHARVTLDGVGHYPFAEAPERFAQALAEWRAA